MNISRIASRARDLWIAYQIAKLRGVEIRVGVGERSYYRHGDPGMIVIGEHAEEPLAVFMHEIGHHMTSYRTGGPTSRIVASLFGGWPASMIIHESRASEFAIRFLRRKGWLTDNHVRVLREALESYVNDLHEHSTLPEKEIKRAKRFGLM